jgi:uncharacterized membrane protein YecN with MAPEG domain
MAAAHVPLGRRGLSLRDSHCGTFEIFGTTIKNCDDLRLISAGFPAGGGWIVANRGPYSAWGSCCKHGVAVRLPGREGPQMTILPVTLISAAAAVLLNIWLGLRIGQFRGRFKVSVGDGGHEPLLRRMRAQANYIESAPFILILIGALEISGASRLGLALIAAIYLLVRIAHAIGMEAAEKRRFREIGAMGTGVVMLGLSFWAIALVAMRCLGS